MPRPRTAPPALIATAVTLSLSACGGGTPASTPAPAPARSGATTSAASPVAARPPATLHASRTGHMPAPVQLPAVTARGAGALAIGGLDAGDASVSSIVRVAGGTPP